MENLQYGIVGKFSYGWPSIEELGKIISSQCELPKFVNMKIEDEKAGGSRMEREKGSKKWGDIGEEDEDERRDTYKEGRQIVAEKLIEPTGDREGESSDKLFSREDSKNVVEMSENWGTSGATDEYKEEE
ncbi:hypothetical protein HAX54_004500 [Datura stramonium]|uniref:Uncharacterized protein n=1 Tax=Datura stramonium TaxID=4076 RepID=A0ABS8T8G7_DATST|nr:hypothetical protein [Datura stramonium]